MPKFAANLTMMFTEWGFLDRFGAAADAGFSAVEFLFPYDHATDEIAARLARYGLTLALFNLPGGDWAAGERGMACLPGRFDELKAGVATALDYAAATGVTKLHLMAGMGRRDDAQACAAYERAVKYAAEALGAKDLELLIEPINARSMPGYFLDDFFYAERLIEHLALPQLKLQFDIFHRQILHGDVTMALKRLMPVIGHVQIASVPGRHEPGSGELNDAFIFGVLDELGYGGFVGCEYVPAAGTLAGLEWFEDGVKK
jgi:hydroxypyruvate isomerase